MSNHVGSGVKETRITRGLVARCAGGEMDREFSCLKCACTETECLERLLERARAEYDDND